MLRMATKTVRGILLDVDYVNRDGKSVIRLFVRTGKGIEAFEDRLFKSYFFVTVEDLEKAKKSLGEASFAENAKIASIEAVEKINAEKVLRLVFDNVQSLVAARAEVLGIPGVLDKAEHDIPFARRWLLDHNVQPMNGVELAVEGNAVKKALLLDEAKASFKVGVFDLETLSPGRFSDAKLDQILMASFALQGKATVLSYGTGFKSKDVEVFGSEKEMVQGLADMIVKEGLDVVATYNGDLFDFPYVKERASKLGLRFAISSDGSEPKILRKGRDNAVKLVGLQHLDVYQMLRFLSRFAVVNLIKFNLESVVASLYGDEKEKIGSEEINRIWKERNGLDRLAGYCADDSKYTLKIAEQYLPLIVELCKIVKQPLFEVGRASASMLVEFLIMAKCFETKRLIANRPDDAAIQQRLMHPIKGGYVKEPLSGLHENLAVLDFSSLPYHERIYLKKNNKIFVKKIGEFVEENLKSQAIETKPQVERVRGWSALTLFKNKVCWKPVSQVIKHRDAKQLLKIKTEHNKEITLTPNHSAFTIDKNCDLVLVNAQNLKKGDYLISSKKLFVSEEDSSIDLLETLQEATLKETRNLMVLLPRNKLPYKTKYWTQKTILNSLQKKEQSLNELNKKIQRHRETIRRNLHELKKKRFIKSERKKEHTYSVTERGRIYAQTINLFKPYASTRSGWHIAYFNELRNQRMDPSIKKTLFIKESNAHWEKKLPAIYNIPHRLMWFMGVYVAEGWIQNNNRVGISTSKKETKERLIQSLKFFKPFYSHRRNEYSIGVMSKPLALLLKTLFGHMAENKHISPLLINFPKKHKIDLIEGMVEGDGSIREGDFKYTSISKELIEDLNQLLLSGGITKTSYISSKTQGKKRLYNLYVYQDFGNIKLKKIYRQNHASSLIPRELVEKYLTKRFRRHHRGPRISNKKILQNLDETKRDKQLSKIINFFKNCSLLRIKRIEKIKYNKPVYDIGVKGSEKFFAGNAQLLMHNSLYPTIIISHNVSPDTIGCKHEECKRKNLAPNKQWFCSRKKGLIPGILKSLFEKRMQIKSQAKGLDRDDKKIALLNARQQALKILLNSFYGYLLYSRSRFYSREAGSAITAWARQYVQWVGKEAEKAGFRLLYADTDSAFLIIPKGKEGEDVEAFVERINEKLPGVMNLELEGFFKRGIFVTKESGEGAKKKYALIDYKDNLKIVGFEYVRRDWSPIAKETQRQVIGAILGEGKLGKAVEIVREAIKKLKEGKAKNEELVVFTQIKRSLSKYEAIGPHVAAAKKAVARGKEISMGSVVGYIVTKSGKSISDRAQLQEFVKEGNYDPDYYIEHQLVPAVIKIMRELGYSREDLIQGGKQHKLSSFG